MFRHVVLVTVLLLALAAPAAAEERFTSLTLENDFFVFHGTDGHYTNGLQLAFTATPNVVAAFGQRIFTPTKTYLDPPDPRDRPYAGWLYAMGDWRTRAEPTVDHLTVTVGVVGPAALGKQAQDLVHNVLNEAPSVGWSSQLRNEPTAMVGYERAWPAIAAGTLGAARYDVSTRIGASVGTPLTYASAGTVLRYGSYLPLDLPVTHISLGPPRDGFRGSGGRGWYAWAGLDARAVARNTFIDGNTFRDSASVKRDPFGVDVQIGVAHVWPTARIGFTLIQRSREFEGQLHPDRFGQLALSFAY